MTELYWRCAENHKWLVQNLLKSGTKVNCVWEHDGSTPIYIAAKKGHKEIVEMLLKEGADTSKRTKKGETPLQAAVQGGFAEIVKMIIKTGTTDREDYEQSLKLVANNPYPKVIKLLLKQYLVNSTVACRLLLRRVLISAAEKGYDEIVDMIIRHHGPGDEEVLAKGVCIDVSCSEWPCYSS